jgi:hypothetical protein
MGQRSGDHVMPLSTYAELQEAVAGFLNRDDLAETVPTFIRLAEAMFNRDIRHWKMEERAASTLSGRYLALPDNWLATIRVRADRPGHREMRLASVAEMERMRAQRHDAAGVPAFYCHTAGEIEVFPTPAGEMPVELVYYERIPALSDEQTANWLLSDAPDIYLYGALMQAAPYLADDARVATWGALYGAARDALNASAAAARWSGSNLAVRLR